MERKKTSIEGTRIGFVVDLTAPQEPFEQVSGLVPKAVTRVGNEYAYVVASGLEKISKHEEKLMEESKTAVIDALCREDKADFSFFNRAKAIAAASLEPNVGSGRANFFSYVVAHDTAGYGPISILLEDRQNIEEMEINAPCAPINIYHVRYGRCTTNLRFRSEAEFRHAINKFIYDTDKELGEDSPIIDAQVENARIHAQIKPYALSGAVASIRLADNRVVGPDYLVGKGTTNFHVLAYLWLATEAKKNIVVAGSPASGKTTCLSALLSFVPKTEKIVTIEEDVNELKTKIDINMTVSLYGSRYGRKKVSTREQVINALRMRPDMLVVGEVRGEETRELFSGANIGVPFMTTMHSNPDGLDIIRKLMVSPMAVETRSLCMLDLAVYMKHVDLSKRVLSDAYEYKWLSRAETETMGTEIEGSDSVTLLKIVDNGELAMEQLMNSKVIEAYSKKAGIQKKAAIGELEKRAEFLRVLSESCKNSSEMLEKIQSYGW